MSKLTKEELKEFEDIWGISIYSTEYRAHETYEDLFKRKIVEWLEQKKKQWREEAYEEGKEDADFNNLVERDLSLD